MTRTRLLAAAPVAWSAVLTAILLWPQHDGGYGLGHDMVFTPRQPLSWASVGLGSSSPRAVPVDAVVGLLSKLLDGAIIGRIVLVVPLIAAGVGAARLIGPDRPLGALAATSLAIWNPYVIERLALGQWALLWAYGALPWLVRYAARLRAEDRDLPKLLCWLAAASITPTGGVIGLVTAVVVSAPGRDRRRWWLAVAGMVVLQLPWVVPSIVGPAQATSDPAGVAAFAARSEHAGGAVLSLLGTGGIWDAEVVPGSRSGPLAFVGLVVIVVCALAGWRPLREILGPTTTVRLAVCAAGGFVVAAAASVPGLDAVMRAIVRTVPGAGLLRDAQKWIMPYAVLVALLGGAALTRVALMTTWRLVAGAVALAGPLLLLPDAPGAVRPAMDPVRYPADWSWARAAVGHGGAVAVVPFQSYRSFPWAPGRSVLDPAPRWLPGEVVVSDRLAVSGQVLAGEDRRAKQVETALAAGPQLAERLARAGIGWVLVERDTPGSVPDLRSLTLVRAGTDLALYRVPEPVIRSGPSAAQIAIVLAGDGLAAGLVGAAAVSLLASGARRRVRSQPGV